MKDLIIIGSGPAGLAAALTARQHGLDCLVLERGVIADTVYHYPLCKPLFSTSNEIELEPGTLPREHKPTREQVLDHYIGLAVRERIPIRTGEEALAITPESEGLLVHTDKEDYWARAVLAATGGFGRQRKLNVPGETPERVSYRFVEAYPYALKRITVVGGGNSAAEAALFLTEVGADVTLSLRSPSLDHPSRSSGKPKIKSWVREPLERAARAGNLQILTSSEIVGIGPHTVSLRIASGPSDELVELA
ncbi:MAG TPA: NAD(P)-binding domain-containing protein, partial [Blastocatellia bacterium]|nr:NAD(P)-binding domain-containing protein [Blastocatellia bacterium]